MEILAEFKKVQSIGNHTATITVTKSHTVDTDWYHCLIKLAELILIPTNRIRGFALFLFDSLKKESLNKTSSLIHPV